VSQATLLKQGNFNGGVPPVSGCVGLYESGHDKVVYFENFETDKEPDLRVCLSTSTCPSDIKDLGALKSNEGNFFYGLDSSNTNKYTHVLIWCREHTVLFGNSKLTLT